MARKKNDVEPRREMEPVERLGLRVSAMIGAPKAQLERRAVIHRLDADTDEAWDTIMALLSETDGIEMVFNDDDSVTHGTSLVRNSCPRSEQPC